MLAEYNVYIQFLCIVSHDFARAGLEANFHVIAWCAVLVLKALLNVYDSVLRYELWVAGREFWHEGSHLNYIPASKNNLMA